MNNLFSYVFPNVAFNIKEKMKKQHDQSTGRQWRQFCPDRNKIVTACTVLPQTRQSTALLAQQLIKSYKFWH